MDPQELSRHLVTVKLHETVTSQAAPGAAQWRLIPSLPTSQVGDIHLRPPAAATADENCTHPGGVSIVRPPRDGRPIQRKQSVVTSPLELIGEYLVETHAKRTLSNLSMINKSAFELLTPLLYRQVEIHNQAQARAFFHNVRPAVVSLLWPEIARPIPAGTNIAVQRLFHTKCFNCGQADVGTTRLFGYSCIKVLRFDVLPEMWRDQSARPDIFSTVDTRRAELWKGSPPTLSDEIASMANAAVRRLVKIQQEGKDDPGTLLFPSLQRITFGLDSTPLSKPLLAFFRGFSTTKRLDLVLSNSDELVGAEAGYQGTALRNMNLRLFKSVDTLRLYGLSSSRSLNSNTMLNLGAITICLQNIAFDDDVKDLQEEGGTTEILQNDKVKLRIQLVSRIIEIFRGQVNSYGDLMRVWVYGTGGGRVESRVANVVEEEVRKLATGRTWKLMEDKKSTSSGWGNVVLMRDRCVCGFCTGEYNGQAKERNWSGWENLRFV